MNQTTLCDAIKKQVEVRFKHDKDLFDRTFQPYIVYYSSKRNLLVGGYVETDPQAPLERHIWKTIGVDGIRDLRLTEKSFRPDTSLNTLDKRYAGGIICHVKQNLA